ncbi:hypothetical protein PMAYCL1PPCAC_09906, partial [Pristionchus mayeri]
SSTTFTKLKIAAASVLMASLLFFIFYRLCSAPVHDFSSSHADKHIWITRSNHTKFRQEFTVQDGCIIWVKPNSTAESIGLEQGDDIVKVDGQNTHLIDDVIHLLIGVGESSDRGFSIDVRKNPIMKRQLKAAEIRGYRRGIEEVNETSRAPSERVKAYQQVAIIFAFLFFTCLWRNGYMAIQLEERKYEQNNADCDIRKESEEIKAHMYVCYNAVFAESKKIMIKSVILSVIIGIAGILMPEERLSEHILLVASDLQIYFESESSREWVRTTLRSMPGYFIWIPCLLGISYALWNFGKKH